MLSIFLSVTGVYLLILTFLFKTKDWSGLLMFKLTPLLIGLTQLLLALHFSGFVSVKGL